MKKQMAMAIAFTFLCSAEPTLSWATQAQPVPIPEDSSTIPQVNISGVGVATGTFGRDGDQDHAKPGVDYSDSTLQIGAAQRLYQYGIGSMGFGILALGSEAQSTASPYFVSQAFLNYQDEHLEVLVGRSDNPTAHLVDFPTLRDDDLFTITNPLNPLSAGANAQDHRYSNVAEITLNQGLKFFENFHAQQLINTSNAASTGINSFGATFQYLSTPGMEAFSRFPSFGIGYEHMTAFDSAAKGLHQVYAGGVLNLNESVTNRWDFRVQNVTSFGSNQNLFRTIQDTFKADSNAVSAAIRYLHNPFGRPGYQLALTTGYKTYFKVSNANTVGCAFSAIKRLGEGFSLAGQYSGQWRGQTLSTAQSSGLAYEQVAQLGFIFNWDATFNQHISPRRSILNQQYQYVPN